MLTLSAAEIVGKNLKKGAIVVLESTVYPGVTEEVVAPILERESGLKCGADFKIGYSPERINPGDEAHTLDKITKIVAGMDDETTETLAELYGLITNVYKASQRHKNSRGCKSYREHPARPEHCIDERIGDNILSTI